MLYVGENRIDPRTHKIDTHGGRILTAICWSRRNHADEYRAFCAIPNHRAP